MSAPIVQGWCPGAHKPMMSGDGLVVRVRPYAAEISALQANQLAEAAQRFGNGFIDLTNRANLQVRGVSEGNYPKLMQALSAADLLDDDPDVEVKRNIVISPSWTDGDDNKRLYDELVSALPQFPKFPGKFGFVIDCGNTRVLDGVPGDIRFERAQDGGLIVRADGCETGKAVTLETAVKAALDLVTWFMDHRPSDIRRLPKLLETKKLDDSFQGTPPATAEAVPKGLYAPFGQLSARDLQTLSQSGHPIRITPWRAVIADAKHVDDISLVADPNAAIVQTSACAGRPFCPQASVETRELAKRLAGKWAGHLHVSGCSKGCAKPATSDITLVGRDGRFDLVRNGAPWDDALYTNLSPSDLETLDLT